MHALLIRYIKIIFECLFLVKMAISQKKINCTKRNGFEIWFSENNKIKNYGFQSYRRTFNDSTSR